MYNPTSLEEERLSWRPVVYYNIARPVRRIFEVIDAYGELEDDDDTMVVDISSSSRTGENSVLDTADETNDSTAEGSQSSSIAEKRLATLRYRLGPLLAAEASLAERLSGGMPTPTKGNLFVRSGWQARSLLKGRNRDWTGFTGQRSSLENGASRRSEDSSVAPEKDKLIEEVAHILSVCKDDIKELWEHPAVQRLKDKRRLRLEEWAELYVVLSSSLSLPCGCSHRFDSFLDNITRVSSSGYIPTTGKFDRTTCQIIMRLTRISLDDILHARIQTMGVAEHIFDVSLHGRTVTWHLYDVGGARGQRHTWVPFFDDAWVLSASCWPDLLVDNSHRSAIIFMAPVSAFDQVGMALTPSWKCCANAPADSTWRKIPERIG